MYIFNCLYFFCLSSVVHLYIEVQSLIVFFSLFAIIKSGLGSAFFNQIIRFLSHCLSISPDISSLKLILFVYFSNFILSFSRFRPLARFFFLFLCIFFFSSPSLTLLFLFQCISFSLCLRLSNRFSLSFFFLLYLFSLDDRSLPLFLPLSISSLLFSFLLYSSLSLLSTHPNFPSIPIYQIKIREFLQVLYQIESHAALAFNLFPFFVN
ncbi:unnamed protein product [Acanthosepion pharaonis]|uniref:Uncharacterized protein n=1 Tax=Acanthosepion pharaonis TaxID=158019 RepID=A0A812E301_ACAPH|nr:unnamed protein product [Sepia pharaonis]